MSSIVHTSSPLSCFIHITKHNLSSTPSQYDTCTRTKRCLIVKATEKSKSKADAKPRSQEDDYHATLKALNSKGRTPRKSLGEFEVAEKLEYNSPLPRPCDEANLVGQAPGYFLAWPRKLVSTKLETPPKIMKKKTNKHDVAHKKLEDKQKEKTLESIVDVPSRQLSYPLPEDICHDGVLEFVRLAVLFDRVSDIEVDMSGLYWNVGPWHEHIERHML
ncbi:hypothetical protein POM88_033124 [Heracleum sosnowskyi]|uniref:Uncharacterized protein n=1 Tax=Heracleum sosnowskyi TaxID=360622 RepID=A0AAD8I1S2_9APIA|nr:hypothetical protein POM88_033124 [Heracleum sosnowskyi]